MPEWFYFIYLEISFIKDGVAIKRYPNSFILQGVINANIANIITNYQEQNED